METLTIRAVSPESARSVLNALAEFPAELVETSYGSSVVISLGGDAEIVSVLNALQAYVTARAAGAAQVEFNGTSYVMHPERELAAP